MEISCIWKKLKIFDSENLWGILNVLSPAESPISSNTKNSETGAGVVA